MNYTPEESSDRFDKPENPYQAPATPVVQAKSPSKPTVQLTDYRIVRTGLQMVYYSIMGMIFGGIMAVILMIFMGQSGSTAGALVFAALFGLLVFVGAIILIVGFCMCIAAPQSNEKSKMAISIAMHAISFVVAMAAAVATALAVEGEITSVEIAEYELPYQSAVDLITQVLGAIGTVFFILFCKQVGQNIGHQKLIRHSSSALSWFIALMVCSVLILIWVFSTTYLWAGEAALDMSFVGIALVGFGFVGLIAFILQMVMIRTGIEALKT